MKRPRGRPRKGVSILFPRREIRDPEDLCGGRRLTGKEFLARKAELEKRDRLEREKVAV